MMHWRQWTTTTGCMRSSLSCMFGELTELHVMHFHRFLGPSCVCFFILLIRIPHSWFPFGVAGWRALLRATGQVAFLFKHQPVRASTSRQMALHEDGNELHVDEHEHLLHGRVFIRHDEEDDVRMKSPLSFAQVKLMHGSRTIGTTQTHADGAYTMLFTTTTIAPMKYERKHPNVWLHVFNEVIDPCKAVNLTWRSSFGSELLDVIQADRRVQDGLIWEQSLEIDFREAFLECASVCPVSAHHQAPALMARFHDLQADEFRAAVQELAAEAIGEFPLSLAETGIMLCYGVFAVLLCALIWVSRTKSTELKDSSSSRVTRKELASLASLNKVSSYDRSGIEQVQQRDSRCKERRRL